MDDEMSLTIEATDDIYEKLCDVNVNDIPWIWISDSYGNEAKYVREYVRKVEVEDGRIDS